MLYRLTTLEQFRDYMFRKLGEEYTDVEISDKQWIDILRESIEKFVQYSDGGVYKSKILIDTDGKRSMILPEEVMGITKILGASKESIVTKLTQNIAISGDKDDRDDFFRDYLNDGSVSVIPTYKDPVADGEAEATDGTDQVDHDHVYTSDAPLLKVPTSIKDADSNSLYTPMGRDMGYTSQFYAPFLLGSRYSGSFNDLNLSTYAISMQVLKNIETLFKQEIWFEYKSGTKRLVIGESFGMILVEAEIREAPENFFNEPFFQMMVEEKMLTQWADNLSLKYRSEGIMGNGIDLNTERMLEKASILRDQIEQGIDNDEWDSLLVPFRVD